MTIIIDERNLFRLLVTSSRLEGNSLSIADDPTREIYFPLPRGLYLNLDCIRGGLYLNSANNFLFLFIIDDNYNERRYMYVW